LTAFTRIDVLTLLGGAASAMASGVFLRSRAGIVHRHDIDSLQVVGRISSPGPFPGHFPWQVDGDDLGDTADLEINYEPACLSLILPAG
jgi:hypothetical protein